MHNFEHVEKILVQKFQTVKSLTLKLSFALLISLLSPHAMRTIEKPPNSIVFDVT